jgi:hypothetical protein
MKCPRCENRRLWILIRFSGYVLCESNEKDDVDTLQSVALKSDWDEESPCRCDECHWTGSVGEVRENESPSGETRVRTRVPVTTIAEVKRRLKAQPCPVVWSDCIRYLVSRLRSSEKQIQEHTEQIAALQQSAQNAKGPESDETRIM